MISYFLTLFTLTTSVNASELKIMHCWTGGFAHNHLYINEDKSFFHFKTQGNGLFVTHKKLSKEYGVRDVKFSIPKKNCDLELGSEKEIVCSVRNMNFTLNVYSPDREKKEVKGQLELASIILKKVSHDYTGIKFLVISGSTREKLFLSNGFSVCL